MQMVPDRVPDEACSDPAVWQIEGTHYTQKMPAERVSTQYGTYLR